MKEKEQKDPRLAVPVRVSLLEAKARAGVEASTYVREDELRINILGGIGATTLKRLIDVHGFPKGKRLSERIYIWNRAEVLDWVESREEAFDPEMLKRTTRQSPRPTGRPRKIAAGPGVRA